MRFSSNARALILLWLFLPTILLSFVPVDVSFFADKPRGLVKDFYIYRYLDETNASSSDAEKLLEQTNYMNRKLFYTFAKRIDEPNFKRAAQCLKMGLKELMSEDTECLAIGFSMYNATKLDTKTLKELEQKLSSYDIAQYLHVLYAKDPFDTLLSADAETFYQVFNAVGSKYRQDFLDKPISPEKILELEKDVRINDSIAYIITDTKIDKLKKSLLHVSPSNPKLTHKSLFFLGLNALKLGDKKRSILYLQAAKNKAYYRDDIDKVLFWEYTISGDNSYLEELKKSFDINMYTLLAGIKNEHIIVPKAYEPHPRYNIKDPFAWTLLLQKIKNKEVNFLELEAQKYLYKDTLPQYAFIKERASKYQDHYFAMPYLEHLKGYETKRIALILALARQESRFIPAAISSSFALGMMQFMPFLAKDIAKRKNFQDFELEDMFDPQTSYMFANIHLDYLEKYLYNPVFIAYAYNGGIGFTKRLLRSGTFGGGDFEPLLSMELVPYDESRKYAKKVLANFVIYMQLLGENISIEQLINELSEPEKSDKFRLVH